MPWTLVSEVFKALSSGDSTARVTTLLVHSYSYFSSLYYLHTSPTSFLIPLLVVITPLSQVGNNLFKDLSSVPHRLETQSTKVNQDGALHCWTEGIWGSALNS